MPDTYAALFAANLVMRYSNVFRTLLFSAVVGAFAVLGSSSCSTTSTDPFANDTIHLVAAPSQVVKLNWTTTDTMRVWLTCGCPLDLTWLSSGGDTSAFTLTNLSPVRSTPWLVAVQVKPQTQPTRNYSAWYAVSAVDHYGRTNYDTLRVNANLK